MAFSTHQQATQEITLPVHRAHFCDANAAEFDLNKRFFNILEERIDSLTLDNREEFLCLFQNYFYETIDVGRGRDRGICPDISSPQITVCDVLTRVPRQLWPLPVLHRCPNPFCGAWASSVDMETHRRRFHRVDDQEPHFLTKVHGHMAGLLAVKLTIRST
jgi:hypothetical protein